MSFDRRRTRTRMLLKDGKILSDLASEVRSDVPSRYPDSQRIAVHGNSVEVQRMRDQDLVKCIKRP